MDPLVREGLRPRRLIRGTVVGVAIAAIVIVLVGSGSVLVVVYVGAALALLLLVAWVGSVLYLRTERGRAARAEYLAKRRSGRGE
jgi:peptidoglycan/LPS O-acetylase OafA/YrhL